MKISVFGWKMIQRHAVFTFTCLSTTNMFLPDEGAVSSGVSDVADDARSIASIESVTAGVGGGAGGRRPLIHIWVPSVFMSGSGQNTHHVYQVYLRIREEEWNIYRRYSEFYAFHQVGYPRTTSSWSVQFVIL